MANAETHGSQYAFGVITSEAPVVTGLSVRKYDFRFEPEIFVPAMDGEGHTEAIAMSKSTHRKITGSITGYILASLGPGGSNAIANSFSFTCNGVSRFFLVKSMSEPRDKGQFVEVTCEVESFALVTS